MLRTPIDDLLEYLAKTKTANLEQISKDLKWNVHSLERVIRILEQEKYLDVRYAISPFSKTTIGLKPISELKEKIKPKGKPVSDYVIMDSGQHPLAKVFIIQTQDDSRPTYLIDMPETSMPMKSYINILRNEISADLLDEVSKDKMIELVSIRLKQDMPIDEKVLPEISGIMIREMYGLGDIDILVSDVLLEEIVVNSAKNPVAVYHRKFGWLRTNIFLVSEDQISNISAQIARRIGKQISILNPILDAHLETGDRVNATLSPVSEGNTITMRLFARDPWTIVSLISSHTFSVEMVALLWQAIHYEMNVIVGGGTGSGKTSSLNSLLALIPSYQRIITIEDTRELVLPKFQWNWVPMVTRPPNPEGLGEVTMLDLVVNSLRMRPDRIIMGEIRRKKEAEVLFEAMHTGHSVYGTIHANTGAQVLKRLIEPPIEVPQSEVEDITLLIVHYRDRRKNVRRALELSEVLPGTDSPKVNQLYHWRPRTDTFETVKEPHRYYEELNLNTGMTPNEIIDDQKKKQMVLEWMVKNNLADINQVGLVMKDYYSDDSDLVDSIKKKYTPKKIFGDELV